MSAAAEPDLLREAAQVRVNESEQAAGYLVVHYAVVVGLTRVNDDGTVETGVTVMTPAGQARYITDGLIWSAPAVLDEYCADSDEADCDETD